MESPGTKEEVNVAGIPNLTDDDDTDDDDYGMYQPDCLDFAKLNLESDAQRGVVDANDNTTDFNDCDTELLDDNEHDFIKHDFTRL